MTDVHSLKYLQDRIKNLEVSNIYKGPHDYPQHSWNTVSISGDFDTSSGAPQTANTGFKILWQATGVYQNPNLCANFEFWSSGGATATYNIFHASSGTVIGTDTTTSTSAVAVSLHFEAPYFQMSSLQTFIFEAKISNGAQKVLMRLNYFGGSYAPDTV